MGWLARWLAAMGLGSKPVQVPVPVPVPDSDSEAEPDLNGDGIAVVPIEASFDLHSFHPRDVPSLVDEYIRAARDKGFEEVTIIHGRGKGVQRQVVQRILERHPLVVAFQPASGARALGATVAQLKPRRRGR